MQMPANLLESMRAWDKATLQSLRAPCRRASGWVPPVEYLRLRSRKSAEWGLEDNTACYGQENKIWINIVVCFCLPVSVSLTHPTEASTSFKNKAWERYFIKRCCPSSFNRYITLIFGTQTTTKVTSQLIDNNKKNGRGKTTKMCSTVLRAILH